MTEPRVKAGAAIYNKLVLSVYDLFVLGFSNRWAWRCPTSSILDFYNSHISANHLDVGVGTGYYLDRCRFPGPSPRIMLADLNPNSLEVTARRLMRYLPETHVANILEPLDLNRQFDSVGLSYLLHCLPGPMANKAVVFGHLKAVLNERGTIFGTTLLGRGVTHNFLARRLMRIYNSRGIFGNEADDLAGLERILADHFNDYELRVTGCVAFFVGHT